MKKVLAILAVAGIIGATSCKKEYTCECEVLGVKSSTTAEFKKKSEAEEWCEDGSSGYCELK